jgi:hypothetical protein
MSSRAALAREAAMICITDHPKLVEFVRGGEAACADVAAEATLFLQHERTVAGPLDAHAGELLVDLFCAHFERTLHHASAELTVQAAGNRTERRSLLRCGGRHVIELFAEALERQLDQVTQCRRSERKALQSEFRFRAMAALKGVTQTC